MFVSDFIRNAHLFSPTSMFLSLNNSSHKAPLVIQQQAERSDVIRLSEGSHLIRMLVYLSERERDADRAYMSFVGTLSP
ncbi:hypothetical protein KQQSB11_380153 [Klebsiella quasipneumoniae subsp. quasipneumoniae]|nr:hypothetical protein KQQSB11_380153 [Klebsiella quasipneumoniae subsp. quasipneumoniae]